MFKSVQWLIDHPKFLSNEVYIAGDSYCDIFVPVIVQEISSGIACTNKRVKLCAKIETKLKYIATSLYSNMLVLVWISLFAQFSLPIGNEGGIQPWIYVQVCAFNYNYDFKTPKILYFPPSLSIYLFLSYYITITPFFLYYYHTSHLFINIYSVFLLYILSSKLSIRRQMSALYTLNSLHNDFLCK